jgi:hypothetical protein
MCHITLRLLSAGALWVALAGRAVTFALPGFTPVKREDIELTSRSVVPTPQVDIFNTLNANPVLTRMDGVLTGARQPGHDSQSATGEIPEEKAVLNLGVIRWRGIFHYRQRPHCRKEGL